MLRFTTVTMDSMLVIPSGDKLKIEYKYDPNCVYAASATENKKKFSNLIVHHTEDDHDIDWYVKYQIRGDKVRGGHFGYHFYVGKSGRIIQGAPLIKRTNHINPSPKLRKDFGAEAQNTNAIGISCVGAGSKSGFRPTIEQLEATLDLCIQVLDVLNIPYKNVYGHGEIQTDRDPTEGAQIARLLRS